MNICMAVFNMALSSWEKAITPKPKTFEYEGMAAMLAAMAEFQRQLDVIRQNGVNLRYVPRNMPQDGPQEATA